MDVISRYFDAGTQLLAKVAGKFLETEIGERWRATENQHRLAFIGRIKRSMILENRRRGDDQVADMTTGMEE
jgi:hypothetical protein